MHLRVQDPSLEPLEDYSPPHTSALEQENMIGRVAIRIDETRLISRLWKILFFFTLLNC